MLTRELLAKQAIDNNECERRKKHTHIPTQEIHHQTINVFFCFHRLFFFVSSSTPTINIIPRVRMAAFFPAIATPSTLSHVDVVDVPPNRYTNTKCVNVAFCTTIFFVTHTPNSQLATTSAAWQLEKSLALITHLIFVCFFYD